jgi:hypothetical protein
MENIMFEDVNADVIADEDYMFAVDHFRAMREELGYNSIWDITDAGCVDKDFAMLKDKPYLVRYQYVRPDATSEDINYDLENGTQSSMAEVTMTAWNGTIEALWFAANSCIKQSGTHHMYIEDFEVQEDGSLLLITGS